MLASQRWKDRDERTTFRKGNFRFLEQTSPRSALVCDVTLSKEAAPVLGAAFPLSWA
jgi:hypothetical protein